jgi:putative membrane protein
MTHLYLKAVHIIFVVTWFAGLFYMPRLLIYITEAHAKPEPESSILIRNFKLMASRLWFGITWPSAVITLAMGISMLINQPEWLAMGFMHVKLLIVFFLYLYHGSLHYIYNLLKKNIVRYTSQQLRVWNEVATIFLISIVFIIVLKDALKMIWGWGLAGLLLIMILIAIGINLYKKFRNEK